MLGPLSRGYETAMPTQTDDLAVPDDAIGADGLPLFEANNGMTFLAAPEAKTAHLAEPSEEVLRRMRHVRTDFATRSFTLRTRHARRLWTGRLPPVDPDGPFRIPGIPFAHFVLRGLLRRHAQIDNLDVCLGNLKRHVNAINNDVRRWRYKNHQFADRYLPIGTAPLYDHTASGLYVLKTQIPPLMTFATAIAMFDRALLEASAVTEVARDSRQWNHHFSHWRELHGRIRGLLYAIVATRKIGLPHPPGTPVRFSLADAGDVPRHGEPDDDAPEPESVAAAIAASGPDADE